MFVPDTNILIYALSGIEPYSSWLVTNIQKSKIILSAVVLAEFLSGANKEERIAITKLSDITKVVSIDRKVAEIGAKYRRECDKKTKKVWLFDCLIAATCKIYSATLVTYDKIDYPMKDIPILRI